MAEIVIVKKETSSYKRIKEQRMSNEWFIDELTAKNASSTQIISVGWQATIVM